jgi:hypothetical protein
VFTLADPLTSEMLSSEQIEFLVEDIMSSMFLICIIGYAGFIHVSWILQRRRRAMNLRR